GWQMGDDVNSQHARAERRKNPVRPIVLIREAPRFARMVEKFNFITNLVCGLGPDNLPIVLRKHPTLPSDMIFNRRHPNPAGRLTRSVKSQVYSYHGAARGSPEISDIEASPYRGGRGDHDGTANNELFQHARS